MCTPFPGRVTAVDAEGATVETDGTVRRATTLVVPDVRPGDWVLVASGAILRRLEPDDAREVVALLATARYGS
ncbi:MAG TPA: HypC/HybG/HupF family hydrogenase formation chaperone [Candidatus Limnocylindrales bacterium]|nr:HypC/HybG/HupF family hydrogenase formation chaperone [Candidatus Limnocylindrales bacterium]